MSRLKKVARNEDTQPVTNISQEKVAYTTKTGIKKAVTIIPRNIHQEEYLEYLMDPEKMIVIAQGPAGTGKTLFGMLAAIKALSEKTINKIILCRPAVSVDEESHGFLPGTLEEKLAPYLIPLLDVLSEYFSMKTIESMIENKIIEVTPLGFMRGRNIKKAFVVLDESQNACPAQLKAIMTRLCDGSKLIITGDNEQSDRRSGENGLFQFKNMLEVYGKSKYIACVEFNHSDLQRHPVVGEVLKIFGDF